MTNSKLWEKCIFFRTPTLIIIGGYGKFEKGSSLSSTGGEETEPGPSQYKYVTRTVTKNGSLQDPNIVTEKRWNSEKRKWCFMIYGRGRWDWAQSGPSGIVRKTIFFRNPPPYSLQEGNGILKEEATFQGYYTWEVRNPVLFQRAPGRGVLSHKKVHILFLERTIFYFSSRAWL